MVNLTLYGLDPSPPVRAVKLTLAALQIAYKYVNVNVLKREQLSAAYLAKNPQGTVPMLEDGAVCFWDSHAIMAYLVRKYAKDDALYPKDFYRRAVVDQRLHFESGVVFANALISVTKLVLFKGVTAVPKERIEAIVEAYDFTEAFLKNNNYIAGDQLTIADFSLISSISSMLAYVEIDAVKYPRITAWMQRMQQLPYYEENAKGARLFVASVKKANFTVLP
ncbi:glutathione S-transferase 1 [Drosophila busckii]|uniref:glutathione S-transferase 1 n=1 Tax=Drosophila busckii TaxID=30019 RepID=UPI0014332154|nr:glutathione S-transferase 1 [Drosophila busckii]XP_033150977.1 glutathione S-transferase 1 [Drosophila busckii]